MSAIDTVRARVTPELKREASTVLGRMGLTVSDAIRLLLTRVAADKALPFDVRVPNKSTLAAIQAIEEGDVDTFESVDALFDDLGLTEPTANERSRNTSARKKSVAKRAAVSRRRTNTPRTRRSAKRA